MEISRVADAIDALERAIKLNPRDGIAWASLASAYSKQGNDVKAKEARREAGALNPNLAIEPNPGSK